MCRANGCHASATVKITNASILQVVPNVDFTEGALSITFDRKGIVATGPLKINGFPATVNWDRPAGPGSKATATLTTELDDDGREKLGIKIGHLSAGPRQDNRRHFGAGGKKPDIQVTADLGRSEMAIGAISWYRPPTKNTTASFTYRKQRRGWPQG